MPTTLWKYTSVKHDIKIKTDEGLDLKLQEQETRRQQELVMTKW